MDYDELVAKVIELLQREKRVPYRALKRRFELDDDYIADLKVELIEAKRLAIDENDRILVWIGDVQEVAASSAPQGQPSPQGTPLPTVPPAPDAERRQLSVLFCDLVDSTRLAGQLDPEDWRNLVREYQRVCSEVIQRYEGYVAQLLGDGLLSYFGYPMALEESAHRAVRTGLEIIDAVGALNARLEQEKGITLAVRLGIHTGVVVVGAMGGAGRQEQLALGDVPNIAARLQGLAEPNAVLISSSTYQLVQGYFDCQELGEQTLRGVAEPIAVYRVLQESGVQSRLDVTSTRGLTPLVGREQEIGLLLERWEQSKAGHGQVVLLSGEGGIGKSRLVQVLKDQVAREPHTRQECRCSPYHTNSAFFPLAELLQRRFGWQSEDTADEKLHKLETVLPQTHLDINTAVPLFTALLSLPLPDDRYPPLQLSSQQQRQHTLDAFLQLLLLAAEQHPVLFIVEDLHWVDPSTLEFLELLIAQTPSTSLYLLATCRPEFQPPWSHRSYLTEITVNRLSREQIERVAAHVASGKKLPPEVLQQIVEKTDGVPLFVEEMTKAVLESGVLKETNGQYALSGSLSTLSIPATLHDSLMARLDRLVTAKAVAQYAAVIGRQFTYDLLHTVSQLDEVTLQRELRRLGEAEIVYQRGMPPQATYMFKHALIQDAAYASLLKSTRQHYHRRIAQVLEAQFPETAAAQPELIAHHYTEAGLSEQAVGYWQQAGEQASARSAYVEAIVHLTKGLELLQVLPETSARTQHELLLQCTLAASLTATHGYTAPEVGQTYMRAHQLCQKIGEPPQLFPVLDGLRRFYVNRGEVRMGREVGEQLLSLAQRHHDTRLVRQAHNALGHALSVLGEFTLARTHLEQSMACYTPQPLTTPASRDFAGDQIASLIVIAPVLWSLGYPDQAVARIHDALRLTHELVHLFTLAAVLPVAARLHQLRREVQAAKEQAETVITLASEQGFAQASSEGAIYLGWAMTMQDQDEEGVAQLHQGLNAYRATGAEQGMAHVLVLLADAYGKLGHIAQGLAVLTETVAQVEKSGERRVEAELHRLKGELLLQQSPDNQSEAETSFQRALSIARHQQAKSWELRAATSLARLWQHQEKRQEAYDLLAPVYHWFTEGFDTADLKDAKALLDELR